MAKTLNWGILGTGNIARQFAAGVKASPRGQIIAVGSRTEQAANAFARERQIPAAYSAYDEVLADREVQAVYISLPNSMHREWTIKALRAGKHVLCEKPFASNSAEAQEMIDEANKTGLVLVEAFMYRAHPLMHAVIDTLRRGDIGTVRLVRSSFCYRTKTIEGNIRFDPALAGGALMDIGCYCINLALLIAGEAPDLVHATGNLHPSGVDDLAVGTLRFPGGLVSSFTCGMTVQADNAAYICGTEGYIEIPVPWKPPVKQAQYTIARNTPPRMDQPDSKLPPTPPRVTNHVDAHTELYGLESDDFAATVFDARPPLMSARETLTGMAILDEMRRQLGVNVK